MIHLFLLIVALGTGGGILTRMSPTVKEIKSLFDLAQKYYAAKDYDNGVKIFRQIVETTNRAILDVDTVTVEIDDLVLPIRVAAEYQVGNSYRNVGLDLLERSRLSREEGDSLLADQRRGEALRALASATQYFSEIAASDRAPYDVRAMSQYQIVRADYAKGDYAAVVEDVASLAQRFPGDKYEEAAFYDLGWAYFKMADYPHTIETFKRVLALSTDAVRTDRAIFQVAEAYGELADYPEALVWYQRLVDKYDFAKFAEKELKAMQTAKLRGVVQETTRELVAKAQIRIGDTYAQRGDLEQAIAAYAAVPQRYPQEQFLVEQSYTRLATLILERRGLDAGIRAYQQAIQSGARQVFQATAQLQIARLLFGADRFSEAIEAYRLYLKAYADVARLVGFGQDKVVFKVAEAFREIGRTAASDQAARAAFGEALVHYDSLLAVSADSALMTDAEFGKGDCYQALARPDSAMAVFQDIVQHHPAHPVAPSALLQIVRLHYGAADYLQAVEACERLIATYPQAGLLDEAHLELGMSYNALNRLDEALTALSQVSRASPNWIKVRVEIGELLTSAGRYAEAQEGLDEAISLAADDRTARSALYYIKGKIAYSLKKYGEAVPALATALADSADEQLVTSGRFMRGLSYYELGKGREAAGDSVGGAWNYERSIRDIQDALGGNLPAKTRNVAYRTLGIASAKLGRSAETIHYYAELIARTADARERADLQLLLMELYYDQQRFAEAIAVARQLIQEEFADNDEMGYFTKERAYSVLSSAELERKNYREALEAAREGLARYPHSGESASLAFAIGLAHYQREEYPEAAAGFAAYAEQFPQDKGLLYGYYYAGQCYQILGEYAEAASWFRGVADHFAGSGYAPEALFLCAENLYNELKFQQALATYDELLRRFPESDFADDALYSSAWALFEFERKEDGVRRMEELVARFPQSSHAPRAQFTIGDHYYLAKDYQKAQGAYRQVASLFPASAEASRAAALAVELDEEIASQVYDEAVALHHQGEYQQAIQLYQSIAEQYPKTYTTLAALSNMGVALEYLGDKRRAEQIYREVLGKAGAESNYQEVVAFAQARLKHL